MTIPSPLQRESARLQRLRTLYAAEARQYPQVMKAYRAVVEQEKRVSELQNAKTPQFGSAQGKIKIAEDFDESLDFALSSASEA